MWQKIDDFTHRRAVLSALLISLFMIATLHIWAIFWFVATNLSTPIYFALNNFGALMLSLFAILLMKKLYVFDANDFKFFNIHNFAWNLMLGWLGILFGFFGWFVIVAVHLYSYPDVGLFSVGGLNHLVILLNSIATWGLFTEIPFRCLVLKILLRKFAGTKRGILAACVISSALFGLLNLVGNMHFNFWTIVNYLVFSLFIGIYLSMLFLRTRALWVPIIVFGFMNYLSHMASFLTTGSLYIEQTPTYNAAEVAGTALYFSPFAIAGLIMLLKVKPKAPDDLHNLDKALQDEIIE